MKFPALVLTVFSFAGCSTQEKRSQIPPVGRRLVRVPLEQGSPYKGGRGGSGFGDACANVLRDSTTGGKYLLARSTLATASSRTSTIDSGAILSAVGYYA